MPFRERDEVKLAAIHVVIDHLNRQACPGDYGITYGVYDLGEQGVLIAGDGSLPE